MAEHLRTAVAFAVLGLAFSLAGCATGAVGAAADEGSSSSPSSTTEPSADGWDGEAVSGHGPTDPFPGIDFAIPSGARSVDIDFECTGGGAFSVELGDSMLQGEAPVTGTCDGTHRLTWPITAQTQHTLYVMLPADVEWTATPHFSADEFVSDAALTADCAAFSDVYSALMNADLGFTIYEAVDEAEWTTRVDDASADLASLADVSESALADAFAEIAAIVSDAGRTTGAALDPARTPVGVIHDACNVNQTPLVIVAEFGG